MKDFLLIINFDKSVFIPQTDKAKAKVVELRNPEYEGEYPDRMTYSTHEFTLPSQIAALEDAGLTIQIQDERRAAKAEEPHSVTS